MARFDPKQYSINDFREWNERNELELAPEFQRRSVWSAKARSYLIDTVLRGLPISKIFMRHDINPRTNKSTREIVDGQQRLRAIFDYLADGFKVLQIHNEEYGGKYYSQLPEDVQKDFLHYLISVDVLLGAENSQVLDIFARLNTYTVRLNKQELLNAKYFGAFKMTAYRLGLAYVSAWINNRILTYKDVARMSEAELASELIIFILDGIQDRKKIEEYYKKYDDEFEAEREVANSFGTTMDLISEILGESLGETNFSKKPLFYTLFGVIYELNKESKLNSDNYARVRVALSDIDAILDSKPSDLRPENFEFYDASTKHVTDSSRRENRHDFIKQMILRNIG